MYVAVNDSTDNAHKEPSSVSKRLIAPCPREWNALLQGWRLWDWVWGECMWVKGLINCWGIDNYCYDEYLQWYTIGLSTHSVIILPCYCTMMSPNYSATWQFIDDNPNGSSSLAQLKSQYIDTNTCELYTIIICHTYRHTSTYIQIIILQAYSSSRLIIALDAKLTPASFPHDGSLIAVWVLIWGLEWHMWEV